VRYNYPHDEHSQHIKSDEFEAKQTGSSWTRARRDDDVRQTISQSGENWSPRSFAMVDCSVFVGEAKAGQIERRKGKMTRQSFQQGYVSQPIHTRQGIVFKIRYRVRMGDGKWKHKSETLHGVVGRKAARSVLERRIRDATPARIEAADLTLKGFVEKYWRPYLGRKNVKPSTRTSYESALAVHILPSFGDLRIGEIVPLHIENLLQVKLTSGLASKSVRNLIGLLQGIFSLAEDNDLILRSPVRNKHKPSVQRREKPSWTANQVRSIVEAVPTPYHALFATLTGARLGELLALQWRHIDLAGRKLRIEQSLWRSQLFAPKTAGSVRTIYFGEGLTQALTEHSGKAARKGLEDFVFCKQNGEPLHPDVLRKHVLYPALDRLGIPRSSGASGFHTFRHSAASFINAQTGNLKLAQKLLGHSTIYMTAEVYTHTSAEAEREAALAVERAIYGDLFPNLFPIGNNSSVAAVN
jgi:integrase